MDPTEPGYYEDGSYGIRIENVVIVRTAQTPNNFGDKGFLAFEHVTLVRQKQNGQPPDSDQFCPSSFPLQPAFPRWY